MQKVHNFTVEYFGSKGWEICLETDSKQEALRELKALWEDRYKARVTSERGRDF